MSKCVGVCQYTISVCAKELGINRVGKSILGRVDRETLHQNAIRQRRLDNSLPDLFATTMQPLRYDASPCLSCRRRGINKESCHVDCMTLRGWQELYNRASSMDVTMLANHNICTEVHSICINQ
jgi:hypothetical protein